MSGLSEGEVTDDSKVVIGFDENGNAIFEGQVIADDGEIAGWKISDSGLSSDTVGMHSGQNIFTEGSDFPVRFYVEKRVARTQVVKFLGTLSATTDNFGKASGTIYLEDEYAGKKPEKIISVRATYKGKEYPATAYFIEGNTEHIRYYVNV
jgi:hypothetical protein